MDVPPLVWTLTILGILALLFFDFFFHVRTAHAPTLGEAAIWSAVYVGIAVLFGVGVWLLGGATLGSEYFAGYITEKALSVDNLFVFLIIMASFKVPRADQQKALLFGIVFSLLARTVDGRRVMTPMLLVMVAIGGNDVLFALDSIPAIFGLTQSVFIVFTATAFSLLGLRQLYFLIDGLLDRLIYLSYGLAAILGFIGVKLILHALHENNLPFVNDAQSLHVPEISTGLSLSVIAGVLVVTVTASLIGVRAHAARVEHRAGESHDKESNPAPRD